MGVAISTHSSLAPVSLASTIIGFVSFIFTVVTATRVFWDELSTWSAAPHEIEDHLTNLKQSLFEERFHMKRARRIRRRRSRSAPTHGERGGEKGATPRDREFVEEERAAALRAMSIALKHMIRNFRELERPFLRYPNDDRGRRKSARGDDAWFSDEEWRDDMTNVYFHPEYRECSVRERLAWLKNKSSIMSLSAALTRLTIRRIGIQTAYVSTSFRELGRDINDFDDRMYDIGQRLSRVVGVRRVE